jgi:trk system potassium uptake protein
MNPYKRVQLKPTQIIVIGFAFVIILGTLLLTLPLASQDGKSAGLIDAFFTATSAVCVTGLVVRDTATQWTIFGQVVILLLIQIGGIGFMTFGTLFAMVIGKKITYKERVVIQESLNQMNVKGIVKLSRNILLLTFVIELIGAFFLSFRFIPLLGIPKGIGYSLFHSISAFCNAGFDLMGSVTGPFSSLTSFKNDLLINFVLMILIILGGLGFSVIIEVYNKRKFKKLSLHSKIVIRMTSILLILGFIMTFVLEFTNPNSIGNYRFIDKILPAMFQSVTTRTAGYNSLDLSQLTTASIFLTMLLMFIGGSSGSTAGGIKTTTFGVVLGMMRSVLKGDPDTEIFGRRISSLIVKKSVTIIGLALSLILFVTMVLSITETNAQFKEILFEVISAFATVGLSLGLTPSLSIMGKIMIAITMFLGRVGPLTFFLAITYKESQQKVKFPEENLLVG